MTYSVGSTILSDDYNVFATGASNGAPTNSANVNNLWGAGNGNYGFGQSTTLSAVASGNTITATQWSTLISRVNSIKAHQTGGGVSFTNTSGGAAVNIASGEIIYQLSQLNTAISSAYTSQGVAASTGSPACHSTASQSITDNSKSFPATQPFNTITMTFVLTWSSGTAMRYFFNAGGYLEFTMSMPNSGTSKTQSWSNLLSDVGTVRFGGISSVYTGYSGTWDTTRTDFNRASVPTSPGLWFKKYNDTGVGDYNANYVEAYISRINSDSAIAVTINMNDAAADSNTAEDYVNNVANVRANVFAPGTSYISNTWGTVTVVTS